MTQPLAGSGTILVIDDEEILRRTSRSILKSIGYKVLVAENGQKGVELFLENRDAVDLVLMDMIMPEMNGMECFREIRRVQPDIPVILSSGFTHEDDIRTLTEEGLNGFLQKPYTSLKLSRAIRKVLEAEKED